MIGEELLEVVAEQPGAEHRLARVHPVLVAAEGVDLAVVDQVAVRVRPLPAREGVGAEAGMDEDDGRFEERVRQVGEIVLDLAGGQHPLVDDGAAGNALEVEVLAAGPAAAVADLVTCPLADQVELALEVELPRQVVAGADEQLPNAGLAGARRVAEIGLARGHVAPAQDRLPLFRGDLLEPLLAGAALGFVRGQEQHGDAVTAPLRQLHTLPGQLIPKKRSGIWVRMPAPSPVLTSQPRAPRWSRLHSTSSACSTMPWDAAPLMWATNPMPQPSRSFLG